MQYNGLFANESTHGHMSAELVLATEPVPASIDQPAAAADASARSPALQQ